MNNLPDEELGKQGSRDLNKVQPLGKINLKKPLNFGNSSVDSNDNGFQNNAGSGSRLPPLTQGQRFLAPQVPLVEDIHDNGAPKVNDEVMDYLLGKQKKENTDDQRNDIIRMADIQKTYLLGIEGVTAVRGVDLTVKEGEFLCILGTSGGGKSTLLNIMGTIDQPSRGQINLFGTSMRSSTSDSEYAKIRLEKIGFVFQSFNLIGTMTSLENVEMPMLLRQKLTRDQIKERAKQLLEEVGLKERMNHYPNMLSGGEQQRVTIARALANEPKLLLMDEPTGDLDTKNRDLVIDKLVDLNQNKGITMVMVTHDEYMKQYAHRVIKIVDGKIAGEEFIKKEVNEKAYREIREEAIKIKKGQVELKQGAIGSIRSDNGKTITRKVKDYEFYQFQMRKKQELERKKHQNNLI